MLDKLLVDQGGQFHALCDPTVVLDQRNAELKKQVVDMILWVEENSARSKQVEIGPSEMGNPCDQRIARTFAGMPRVNFNIDPWPAIVGTAVHRWLEKAIGTFQKDFPAGTPVRKWQTEMAMSLDDMIPAHSDLYTHEADVVDWKTAGPTNFAKIKREGPPDYYVVQGHLYGYAHERAGRPVRDVVLAFLPRAGWLKDTFLWREPYDRRVALRAIARVYDIGEKLIKLDVEADPARWAEISMTPGEHCYSCPFFVDRPAESGPDATGCPGQSKTAEERKDDARKKFERGLV